ncbi:MAG: cupin-like domain-containing protein [Bdellovibrionales bacterium]|nr:cupin-like domain-containing protein [Bdellovibrionales bacterium]
MSFLDECFPKVGEEKFLKSYWPERAVVNHGPMSRFLSLENIPELEDIEEFLKSCNRKGVNAQVDLPDKRDEHHRIENLNANDALKLFNLGMNLRIARVHDVIPSVREILRKLEHDLGLSEATGATSLVYISPKGKAAGMHWDANANFVVQILGKKKWRFAPNKSIKYPLRRYAVSMNGHDVSRWPVELPKKMPQESTNVILKPGSAMYLPRGWWHDTEGVEPSLSLNFTFTQIPFSEIMASVIRQRLNRHEQWRQLAFGMTGSHLNQRQKLEKTMNDLIQTFLGDIGTLKASDLINEFERSHGSVAGQDFKFRKEKGVTIDLNRTKAMVRFSSGNELAIDMSAELLTTISWISKQNGEFMFKDVCDATPHVSEPGVYRLLKKLEDAKILVEVK